MSGDVECAICVVGGGPAGAVISRRLAELGHDVALIERAAPQRRPRAELLAASILPILDTLRLREEVEATVFCREKQAVIQWGSRNVEIKRLDASPSLLIERALLDDRLRAAATRAGVRVFAPASAGSVRHVFNGQWQIPVRESGDTKIMTSRFLVDARGKRPFMSADNDVPATVALSASWKASDRLHAETRIEAGAEEWFWGTPLPGHSYAATVFLDPARIAGLRSDGRMELYRHLISHSRLLNGLTHGGIIGPVGVRDATARLCSDPIGSDFIRVGEAAVSIDPLSSQGIQTALLSAIQGSAAVHTLLTEGFDPAAAIEFYRERQRSTAARSGSAAARLYGEGPARNSFWSRRSSAAEEAIHDEPASRAAAQLPDCVSIARSLQIIDVPVLSGHFIRRAPALRHPRLEHPVAYFAGVALAPLVRDASGASTTDQILRRWTKHVSPETAWSILTWMHGAGLLVSDVGADNSQATMACR